MYSEINRFLKFATIFLLASIVAACGKIEFNELVTKQEGNIENYIEKNFEEDVVHYNGGVWRVIIEEGSGAEEVAKGDTVVINYKGYLFTNSPSTLFDTNVFEEVESLNLGHDPSYYQPREYRVGRGRLIEGLERGILGMKRGEQAMLFFSTKYGYGSKELATVPKKSALMFQIELLDVRKR